MEHFTWELQVTITDEDIKQGKQKNCRACPLALAASRYFGESYSTITTTTMLLTHVDRSAQYWSASQDALRFMFFFDRGRAVSGEKTVSFFFKC